MGASAQQRGVPLPTQKPLLGLGQERFVEGADVPLAKPVKRQDLVEMPGERQECVLEQVEYSQREAVRTETGCGFGDAVVVTAFMADGNRRIGLSEPLTVTCGFAAVFAGWVIGHADPAARDVLGSPLERIVTGPGYQCRRRNNQPDGKLSEHALGKAIDVSGFLMQDGRSVTVEAGWNEGGAEASFLKTIHASACEIFATVLGPEADPHHASHIHLDTGCHGKDCTYLICQ